jgi:hypothetical protein
VRPAPSPASPEPKGLLPTPELALVFVIPFAFLVSLLLSALLWWLGLKPYRRTVEQAEALRRSNAV